MVPSSTRFSPAADVRVLCATLTTRRTSLHMPPDYQKLVRLIEKRVPKHVDTLFTSQFSSSMSSATPTQIPPVAVTSFPNPNNYKPTFGPISGGMTPNPPHMQIPSLQPHQSHHIQQFPASQVSYLQLRLDRTDIFLLDATTTTCLDPHTTHDGWPHGNACRTCSWTYGASICSKLRSVWANDGSSELCPATEQLCSWAHVQHC